MDVDARVAVGKKVAIFLQHPETVAAFPAVLPTGIRHVLVALPSDKLGPLFKRLKALRGAVNVAVPSETDGILTVIVFHPSGDTAEEGAYDDCAMRKESEVGMLVVLLQQTRKPARCRFVESDYEAELVDVADPDGSLVCV